MVGNLIHNFSFYNVLFVFSCYFIFKLISNFFYNTKKFFYNNKLVPNILILNNSEIQYFMTVQLILVNSYKTSIYFWQNYFNTFFFLIFFFLVYNLFFVILLKNNRYFDSQINLVYNICLWFLVTVYSLFSVDNFINLLLLLELIGVLYYFFFLEQVSASLRSFIKLKNMLNSYLWLAFFTLIFLFLSFISICSDVGTLAFSEITYLSEYITAKSWIFLFIGFFFKLGVSGFHILKFEVYKHLSSFYLIFFSLYTFYLNSLIFLFLFVHLWSIFIIYQQMLLNFILFFNLALLISGLKLYSFYQFIAFSTVNTWSIMLLFLSI